MRTGFNALKLSIAGFIIPYLFVYNPAMLLIETEGIAVNAREFAFPPAIEVILITLTAIIGIIGLSAAVEGYFKTRMNIVTSILLGAGALLMIVPETYTDIIGVIIVLGIFALNYVKERKETKTAVSSG